MSLSRGRLLIVDLLRPTNFLQRLLMFLMFHRGLRNGVQDVLPFMQKIGYTEVQLKKARWTLLGYLHGQR